MKYLLSSVVVKNTEKLCLGVNFVVVLAIIPLVMLERSNITWNQVLGMDPKIFHISLDKTIKIDLTYEQFFPNTETRIGKV